VSDLSYSSLLDFILDSWDRNNQILINLLRALPPGGLEARAHPTSPTVARMFTHMYYVRLILLSEDAPQFPVAVPSQEWFDIADPDEIATQLEESARAVRTAVESLLTSGTPMLIHYDNPLLYLQHMIWHEGYHHGQIKLALKATGHPFDDEEIGPYTWAIWFDKEPDHQARLEKMKATQIQPDKTTPTRS
jgi:uncharacterized damage-inducible protein DinB